MSAFVVLLARIGFILFKYRIPVLPKIISVFIRLFFSCQISPGASIGRGAVLSYGGLGVVIHGACVVGERVNIGTNVTLGGNFSRGGVPRIEDDVFVGTGAKILGPVTVGKGAVIGANSVVLSDVPSYTVYAGVPARHVKNIK